MGYSMVKIDEVDTGQEEVNVIVCGSGSYEAHGPF